MAYLLVLPSDTLSRRIVGLTFWYSVMAYSLVLPSGTLSWRTCWSYLLVLCHDVLAGLTFWYSVTTYSLILPSGTLSWRTLCRRRYGSWLRCPTASRRCRSRRARTSLAPCCTPRTRSSGGRREHKSGLVVSRISSEMTVDVIGLPARTEAGKLLAYDSAHEDKTSEYAKTEYQKVRQDRVPEGRP